MRIIRGLQDGMVMQRGFDDTCDIIIELNCAGVPQTTAGQLEPLGQGRYRLRGIPVGRPYKLELADDSASVQLSGLYVGDVWMLAGQSNMEGAGKMRPEHLHYEKAPVQSVRAFYMNEKWDVARPQLHQLWASADRFIAEFWRNARANSPWGSPEPPAVERSGVGPGLYFALEMRQRQGVPQGLIPCGIGGSCLAQWQPGAADNYYSAMLRRFNETGSHIRGVFWYQGEGETGYAASELFIGRMQTLVAAMRSDFASQELPFVQVQINRYAAADPRSDPYWIKIRELQRNLADRIPFLETVFSVDCGLDDLIHLSSEAQQQIGARAAEAMDWLCGGNGLPSPALDKIWIEPDEYTPFYNNIIVRYRNLHGDLLANGVPSGFFITKTADSQPERAISKIELRGNLVCVKTELSRDLLREYCLFYAFGNIFYCNITDSAGRSIPAMGPIKIGAGR